MSHSGFDISMVTSELKAIDTELARLRTVSNGLKKRKKEVEDTIQKYLDETKHKGVMINNMTILSEQKVKNKAIPKKEKEDKLRLLLGQYVSTPEQVLLKLQEASKGTPTVVQKLSINYEHQK